MRNTLVSTIKKISISLPKEMATMLQDTVAEGTYSSSSEVVREALREWQDKRRREQLEIKTLRKIWDEGITSGTGEYKDIHAIKKAARALITP